MDLHLTDDEEFILRDVLNSAISDLGQEISGTDRLEFREALKERRRVLQKVVDALSGGSST